MVNCCTNPLVCAVFRSECALVIIFPRLARFSLTLFSSRKPFSWLSGGGGTRWFIRLWLLYVCMLLELLLLLLLAAQRWHNKKYLSASSYIAPKKKERYFFFGYFYSRLYFILMCSFYFYFFFPVKLLLLFLVAPVGHSQPPGPIHHFDGARRWWTWIIYWNVPTGKKRGWNKKLTFPGGGNSIRVKVFDTQI